VDQRLVAVNIRKNDLALFGLCHNISNKIRQSSSKSL
jgi:hypothetical protein